MKMLITEAIINELFKNGVKILPIKKEDIVTPLALDRARALSIKIVNSTEVEINDSAKNFANDFKLDKKILIAYDKNSNNLLQTIIPIIEKRKLELEVIEPIEELRDFGRLTKGFIKKFKDGNYRFGILILEDGLGASILCNRYKGIRAVLANDILSAQEGREKFNSNILILSSGLIGAKNAQGILKNYIETNFGGGEFKYDFDDI
jgi:ribose 5-phosphate isomerase B